MTGGEDAERDRIERVYGDYGASERKQRAWRPDNPGNVAIRAELREAVAAAARAELAGGGRVLDVGCGTGTWLADLVELGVAPERLSGIDMAEANLSEAAARIPAADVRWADSRKLPYADGSFQLVLLFTILSSLPDDRAVSDTLAEAWRVTGRGGAVLVYDMRAPSPRNPEVRRIGRRLLRSALPVRPEVRSLTLLPPLARRLGGDTARLYRPLTLLPPLRTHALASWRKP